MMINLNDTIAAIATASGVGAIGIVRLSGENAVNIVNSIFKGADLTLQSSHTLNYGFIHNYQDRSVIIDEVVVGLYLNAKSYTGETSVEINGHGSPYVLQSILEACIDAGARVAQPGEFTQRAFLNGRMDLAQAEAVADLIAADSKAAQQTALNQLRGGFSNDLKELRGHLIHFAAMIELELDFTEEDVEFADRTALIHLIEAIKIAAQHLIASFKLGNVIKNGVSVAIIGKPNAGKSTLLNALLNEERAIVSDIAGTTRDTIEETLNIHGVQFRIIDTAGLREDTEDVIELIGVGKSLEKMREADVVVYLFDVTTTTQDSLQKQLNIFEQEKINYLLVANKVDAENAHTLDMMGIKAPIIYISAKNKENITELKDNLYQQVIEGEIHTENTIITNARHHTALINVISSLDEVRYGIDHQISGEFIAIDIKRCLHYLGEITGEVELDRDILGTIFGKFCIGK